MLGGDRLTGFRPATKLGYVRLLLWGPSSHDERYGPREQSHITHVSPPIIKYYAPVAGTSGTSKSKNPVTNHLCISQGDMR